MLSSEWPRSAVGAQGPNAGKDGTGRSVLTEWQTTVDEALDWLTSPQTNNID